MATLEQALNQMRANGMPPFPNGAPLLNTTRIIRYGPKKRAWYRLYDTVGRNGRHYIHGAYGIWGALESTKIETDWSGMDAAERARVEAEQKAAAAAEQRKREQRAQFAARRAKQQLLSAQYKDIDPPYLKAKGVEPEKGLRMFSDGTLVVPMIRYDTEPSKLMGVQKIAANGEKKFNAGMAKEGTACRLGARPKNGEAVLVCEGIATALSIRAGIRKAHPVFAAFDCYNLGHVVAMLRRQLPDSPIVICADDDFATDGNPGLTQAERAAKAVGNAVVAVPKFADRGSRKWTDFNDLHQAEGLEVVRMQLEAALSNAGTQASAPKKKTGKLKVRPPEFWDRVNRACEEWVMIRGTDTIWDTARAKIYKIPHLRLADGKEMVNFWLASDRRRTVEEEDVVFDPTNSHDPEKQVNLFTGMQTVPAAPGVGSCQKLLQLLHYLCGEDAVFEWVLKWCAYPLQHPGAKMATAVVMHGREGAGKGLWWRAMREIYDPYSALITQRELESDFNAWASRKLLVIGNEVVSRQERQHHVGYLKNLITEEVIQINDKHLPLREEANHMQIVFLSNELQPLQISPDDRRYLIIRTPPTLTEDFYLEVVHELDHGGAQALYRHLLDMDLGDFHAHTKPIMTEAKRSLIELGKSSPQLFFDDLQAGRLPVPFGPCASQDLYRAFNAWCARNGDRMPAKMVRFSQEIEAIDGVRKAVKDVDPPNPVPGKARVQATVFIMGKRDPDALLMGAKGSEDDEALWIRRSVNAFRSAVEEWVGGRA